MSDGSVPDGDSDPGPDLAARRGVDDAVVYQPAEDSGLLAEAAVEAARGRVLEVGTGSGWVAARIAAERDLDVVGTDLNPHAAREARKRGVEAVVADLCAPFRADGFDTVCFNPPYLPTDPDNEWGDWMEHALSGGESGRELIEPFLDDVGRVLAPGGVVLLLVSSLTGYEEVLGLIDDAGFDHEVAVEESFPFETLSVLRLDRRE
ncbi:methyltransferase [Halorubrum sp. Ib24]|uniref:HemK2/MTQ2 family protein methyltransferase n=1 Tax=unclassified Halorubrum TaxID=2642239 RepID=UPI000B996A9A|nr:MULTISPECIES: HemK2/MTQ2 family protein methyltransferase [unclassified Halorubrum]OYR37935.1 methyltransferase [Halorubrum sp. Ib24]OYR39181.1 methyltransferase [Halorubrum sp. Eb13]OYR46446.1 methyltransferase [Halorubrum sp. Hd13]OYR47896.1 methyltransferase [Halorubrum sp. Ea8]OYR53099.1 methyltransferase [Halorubrum sp. Ea1]